MFVFALRSCLSLGSIFFFTPFESWYPFEHFPFSYTNEKLFLVKKKKKKKKKTKEKHPRCTKLNSFEAKSNLSFKSTQL